MQQYRNLIVWKKSMDLVDGVYKITDNFPKEEIYTLTSQIRRAAISIPSNIAEGRLRDTRGEFKRYLLIAFASGGELETQLEIAVRRHYITEEEAGRALSLLSEVMRMLNKLISTQ